MKKIFRKLTTSGSENLATKIIYGILEENESDTFKYAIEGYDELVKKLTHHLQNTLNIEYYQSLPSEDKKAIQSLLISELYKLAKSSINNYSADYLDVQGTNTENGIHISYTWSWGIETWEIKFPDIFYQPATDLVIKEKTKQMLKSAQAIEGVIFQALGQLKGFDGLLRQSFKDAQQPPEKKEVVHAKPKKEVKLSAVSSLYPKIEIPADSPSKMEIKKPERLYPDLAGYDVTPSILKP